MNTIVNKYKLDFMEIVSEGFKIFFFKFRNISLLALGTFIPTILIMPVMVGGFRLQNGTINTVKIILVFFLLLTQVIISIIARMSIAIIVEKVVGNKTISLIDAITLASSKWGRALTTQILASVIIMGLTLLLFIPGVIYSIYYIFVVCAVALRDKDGQEALKYSKTLVEGQWWRVFGISLGIGIIFAIISGVITFPLSRISNNPYFAIIPNTISLFISSIAGVMTIVMFLNNDFVYRQRIARRKEIAQSRKIKKVPSIEQHVEQIKKDEPESLKRSVPKRIVRKAEVKKPKKTSTVKRSTRTTQGKN